MNILITGGASGLGKAIVVKLAQNIDNIVNFTFSSSIEAAADMESKYANTHAIRCDFRDGESVQGLLDKMTGLDLDVLINNAYMGSAIKTYFHKIDSSEFLNDFTNNLVPTVRITQSAINLFRKKRRGKIITVLTSFLINTPPTGSSVYVANKAYLESLTKSWASENAKYNITSNSISPAFMQTSFTSDVDERVIEQMRDSHPLKQILTVEEVAESVVFLINATNQINGINIAINAAANIK